MRNKPSIAARTLLALVAALLLFGQQVGLGHAVWHAADVVAHSAQGSESHEHQPDTEAQRELCAYHVALGTTLGGHYGDAAAFATCTAGDVHELRAYPARTTPEIVPAVSRGPPVLL